MKVEGEDILFEIASMDDPKTGRGHFDEDGLDIIRQVFHRSISNAEREHILKMRSYKSQAAKRKERENWKSHQELFGNQHELVSAILDASISLEFRIKMTPRLEKILKKMGKHNFQELLR